MERTAAMLDTIILIIAVGSVFGGESHAKEKRAPLFRGSQYQVIDKLTYCNGLTKLNRRQLAICIKKPTLVKVLEEGFKQGMKACVNKFKNNSYTRWNCTNIAKKSKSNVIFGVPMAVGTKEAAVMQAFGAVGMFITLTRECINGNIPECSSSSMYRVCHSGSSKSCSVINWEVARKLIFSFMLAGNGGKYWRNPNRFMTRFNAAIGIVAVMESTIKDCDCSRGGIVTSPCLASSSCKEQLPVLEDVATYLVEKYLKAKLFRAIKPRSELLRATFPPEMTGGQIVYLPEPKTPPEVTGKDLVYHQDSPLYCEPQTNYHWGGIGGRQCRPDVKAFDSCSILCCGLGYMIIPEIDKKNCKITLMPRLSIKCETREVYKYYCKYVWMVRRRLKRGKFAVPLYSLRDKNKFLLDELKTPAEE